jgi:hypothetical protein
MNNLLEEIQDTLGATSIFVIGIALVAVQWKFANCQFHECKTDAPYIRLDCV